MNICLSREREEGLGDKKRRMETNYFKNKKYLVSDSYNTNEFFKT